MQNSQEIHNLLLELLANFEQTSLIWQLSVLAVSLITAWWLNRIIRKRFPHETGAWQVGISGINRITFPVAATLLVLAGKSILKHWQPVSLLNIAVPLLLSWAMIRIMVYLLRKIFATSTWIRPWERAISTVIWLGLALHITGFLPAILDALEELSFDIGKHHISLLLVLQGAVSISITVLLAMWLGGLLENRIMRAEHLDMNLRVLTTKFIRACLLLMGVLIALPALGIDLTVLSVFGGAVGIGLGFGLQKIASNYVSGFIILLDKSIHINDLLTIDNRFGAVSRLTARYMVLKGTDGTESIIPNDTLITAIVVNHSYSDRKIRINLPVQISYQSPLETAMGIILEAAKSHPRVITDPEPQVFLKEFGDNGINLELAVWISDPEEGQLSLRSDINLVIWHEFQKQGVEIPFPQRDIRIVSQPLGTPLHVGLDSAEKNVFHT